ncbi:MAG: hypothetical protein BGO45_03675 [Microbacterium sp. 71-36]|uniref:glycosyltransferase n=1 Tax=unclassified Microbacterium TaxID=2609290 RepID=UPI00086CCFAD|nr:MULTISPECIES: glycosyltransferase [unclassified Microbacterium]MBN9212180.1 glycosyltransferase [Microbacterium sp.]ODT43132.1 MAG: hypothetical protein ABS60_00550 [Microbacterium sp. SCN 71-17]OJV74956.1 MAG: hypothetical protein BGO45_03675 [Microbacterium sp. 71-36]
MKIVFLVPKFSGGGAEFVARQWMEHFASHGDQVIAATTNLKSGDPRPDDIRIVDVSGSATKSVRRLRDLLVRERPDAVMALMPYWNLLAVFATRGMKDGPRVVISGRNMATHLRGSFGISYRVKQWLARRVYRWADEFVAISHPVAGEAIALYRLNPARVSVVLNPSLKGTAEQASRVVEHSAPLALVAPARLVHQKRPHLVIETAAACRERHGVEAEAHFYGIGPLTDDVAVLAERLGVVAHFHGWAADWSERLPANAVVVLPSLSEGFGNVLVEAARVSVPSVVTSRALGVADAVVPGITGVLVAGDSPGEFADGVVEAASIPPTAYEGWLRTFTKERSGDALRSRLLALVDRG